LSFVVHDLKAPGSRGYFFTRAATSASRALTVSVTLASREADMIEFILIVVVLLLIGIFVRREVFK
jgi:hypothetical protein